MKRVIKLGVIFFASLFTINIFNTLSVLKSNAFYD